MNRTVLAILLLLIIIAIGWAFIKRNTMGTKDTKRVTETLGLKQVVDIPLAGGTNRFDYQSINYNNHRLYISHLGSSMVTVFDLEKQQVIKDIPLASSPYGIIAMPSLKTVYVGVGGNNQVGVIDEN